MYQLYLAEGRELKPTLDALERAMNARTEEEASQNLQRTVNSDE
jgi:hypothetical protein